MRIVEAVAETDGDALVVRWTPEGEGSTAVDISVGPGPETVDHAHAMTVDGDERSARVEGVGRGRHYVAVAPHDGGGALVVADRRVPFDGVTNFRDLGGYPTSDGGRTRWGRVFRSDALHRFTTDDRVLYQSMGLRAVYDLRGEEERERYPNPFPATWLALLSGVTPLAEVPADAAAGERRLRDMYVAMLANAAPLLGRLLGALANPDALPAVFHCTGGKDRTGISAAVLLESLGVRREHVLDDYELTSRYRLREHQQESYANLLAAGLPPEAAAGVLGAPRWVMADTLDVLDTEYGGAQAYLTRLAGMPEATVRRLRELLVS
ncbi:MAG: tyrosine-protein phosphatase [Acidimicrobiaceae bacterium]|nr:tyrosine-protein phosphatase [Acidimicrobiaceae bacterium]